MKIFHTFLAVLLTGSLLAQVDLQTSNLPILVIETSSGMEVPDEPKIAAHLGIIWNGDGQLNHIDDPYNGYDGQVGIEVRGSSSQFFFPKKGYAVETQLPDSTSNNVPLFGFPAENDWVLHGPYSDKTLMRNAITYIMAGWLMDYAPRVKFCEVVINGEYRGVYLFTEKIKRDKNRVDVSKLEPGDASGDELTGGYILKFDKWDGTGNGGFASEHPPIPGGSSQAFYQYHYPAPDEITAAQGAYIQGFIAEMEDVLASPGFADSTSGYRKYFDMDALMGFIFSQEMAKNVDGYRLSTFMAKDRDSTGGKLHLGPVWDYNLGYGNVNYCFGSGTSGWALDFNDFCPDDSWVIHFWWERIWSDEAFRQEIAARWAALRANELANVRVLGLVDSLENLLQTPAQRNFQRWPVLGEWVWPNDYIGDSYSDEVNHLHNWLVERLAWMDGAFALLAGTGPGQFDYFEPFVWPNPSREGFTFEYWTSQKLPTHIEVFDAQGRPVERLVDDSGMIGKRETPLAAELPQGLYFYQIHLPRGKSVAGKMVKQ